MASEAVIDTLNELISICKDNVDCFTEASQQIASDDPLKPHLSELTECWKQIFQALRAEIIYWEGLPAESGTLIGEVHWLYAKFKAALSADERKIILDELEQLSGRALMKFEEALSQNLPMEPWSIVQLQQGQVSTIYERLRKLQETMV